MGTFADEKCAESKTETLDLALVGYGIDQKTGLWYWKVRNPFGKDWGENSMIRIARKKDFDGKENGIVDLTSMFVSFDVTN